MTTPTPDELARTLFTNDGVCSQYDWDNANEIARQWYRSLARAILPIVNARLDAVTKERDELRAKTLKVENCSPKTQLPPEWPGVRGVRKTARASGGRNSGFRLATSIRCLRVLASLRLALACAERRSPTI